MSVVGGQCKNKAVLITHWDRGRPARSRHFVHSVRAARSLQAGRLRSQRRARAVSAFALSLIVAFFKILVLEEGVCVAALKENQTHFAYRFIGSQEFADSSRRDLRSQVLRIAKHAG